VIDHLGGRIGRISDNLLGGFRRTYNDSSFTRITTRIDQDWTMDESARWRRSWIEKKLDGEEARSDWENST